MQLEQIQRSRAVKTPKSVERVETENGEEKGGRWVVPWRQLEQAEDGKRKKRK